MRPVFVARGPAFRKNYTTPANKTVNSVDIYDLMCFILEIMPPANNGTFENVLILLEPIYFANKIVKFINELTAESVHTIDFKFKPSVESRLIRKLIFVNKFNEELNALLGLINGRIHLVILVILLMSFILVIQIKASRWPRTIWISVPTSRPAN